MIRIAIQGIKDGEYDIDVEASVNDVEEMFPEFFGLISVAGKLKKLSNRFTFLGRASCTTRLVCDITLNEFDEIIEAEIAASFLANTDMYKSSNYGEEAISGEYIIHGESKYIDLTEIVRDQLAVNLPLKRISPEMRGKTFEEIYPEYSANSSDVNSGVTIGNDEQWEALKKLKFN